MRTDYLKRSLIVAGATVAFAAVASAGNWVDVTHKYICLLYTSPSPRDRG